MAYTTTTTSITSATSSRSKQATVYQYPTGNGVVITGASVNSNTTAYLGVTTPGAAQTYTAVSGGATITEIVYLDSDNVPTNANAVSTTGGNIKIVGTGFASGAQVYINNALVTNTVPNSTAIIATLTTGSVGNVSCYIFGSGNSGGAISANSVRFSGAPSWVTAAAVSSVNGIASNIALQASGDGTLTYSLKSGSGSLPTGISLVSSGYLSGTATGYSADTVVTFTLIVRDSENQATQQTFNYTVFIGDTYFKQTSLLLSATVSNTFISDSSTNNFLITRNGDTRPSRFSPYWPGGWSGYFDGTGDYLTVPQSTSFDLPGDFTVECWVYFNSVTSTSFVGKWGGSGTYAWLFQYIAGTGLRFYTGINGGLSTTIDGAWTPVVNIWYHIAATRNSNSVRLFVNGTQVGTTTTNSDNCTATNQALNIGRNADTNIQLLTGYLSNLRILKGTALYTANFTPATTSLTTVANTSLLTLRDAILADDSPNNFAITRNGDTKLTTFSPFNTAPHTITANTNSVYFDGTGDYLSLADSNDWTLGTNNFTIEFWINFLVSDGSVQNIAGQSGSIGDYSNQSFVFYRDANNKINGYVVSGGTTAYTCTSTVSVTQNSWRHVALVRNNNTLTLYIDGTTNGTANLTGVTVTNSSSALSIGRVGDYATSPINGYISNFRLVNGTAVYTANFTPATSALTTIANTSLLACQANTIIDSNTTPKTITVNGNPNVSLSNPFGETITTISNYTWSSTTYGASAYFDGSGDSLTIAANSAFSFGTGDFTVEFWFNLGSASGNYQSMLLFNHSGGSFIMRFGSSGDYSSYLQVGIVASAASNVYSTNLSQSALFGQWTHLAFTRQSSTCRVFVNGIQRSLGTGVTPSSFTLQSFSDSTNIANSSTVYIGSDTTPSPFTGYITDLRVTKGTALYTGPFIPPTAPLPNVANVSLLTLQSDIGSNSAQFVDQSPNNHLITRNGNASQGTYGPLVPSTWSAYFDGTGDYLSATIPSIALGTSAFTMEAWVWVPSSGSGVFSVPMSSIAVNTDGASERGVFLSINNSYLKARFGRSVNGEFDDIDASTNPVSANQWNHIALVRENTSTNGVKLYLNGTRVVQGTSAMSLNKQQMVIGRSSPSFNGEYYTGYISNARWVNSAVYTANFTPSTTTIGPIANTNILTLRGPSFTDDSGYNNTITRNGDTKIVPFGPFSPQTVTPDSYSYRFSNASDYISTTSSNLAFGANNWTIESWVYPRFTANSGVFQVSNVQYGLTNSNLNTVALGFSNSNKAIVRVANATYTSTGTSITANAWTHLALVKSSNVSKLYINGTLDSTIGTSGSITDTVSYTGTTNVAVGGYGSTSALANAYISNFRVVSNSAVYTENFTPAVGPLSAISGTTLLTCQANTVLDASGSNLTITANANVTPVNFNPFDETVTVGQAYSALADGGSAYFDGNGDYLILPLDVIRQIPNNTYTIEFWLYATSTTCPIFLATANNVGYFAIFGVYISNGTLTFEVRPNTGIGFPAVAIESAITINTWNHVTVSVNNGSAVLYVNGSRVGSGTVGTLTDSAFTGLGIGYWPNGFSATTFTGYISNFRVIKGTALYSANFVPPAAPAIPTTANTSLLLNFTSSGVIDSTGRNVLETVADAKVTTNLKKYGTGSYYFDGTGDYLLVTSNSTELAFGAGDFTVEFWFYPTTSGVQEIMYDHRPAGTNGAYLVIYKQSTNVIAIYVNSAARITGTTALAANTWYHIACSRSGTSTKLFLNGTQEGSTYTDTNSYLNATNRPVIATDGASVGSSMMNGYIDDLRITKGYARYTANFTVPSEPFITK